MTENHFDEQLSLVVPTYNAMEYVERLLESIAQQNRDIGEVIFVDDQSPDGTYERLGSRVKELPFPSQVIRLPKNSGGPAKPIMTGLRHATKTWTAVLEQDDLPVNERFAYHLEAARSCSTAVATFGRVQVLGDAFLGKPIEDRFDNETDLGNPDDPCFRVFNGPDFAKLLFVRNRVLTFSNLAVKTQLAARSSNFSRNYRISADMFLLYQLTQQGDFVWINKHIADFHRHSESLFHRRVREGQIESSDIRLRIADTYKIDDPERIHQHYWLLRNGLDKAWAAKEYSLMFKIGRLMLSNPIARNWLLRASFKLNKQDDRRGTEQQTEAR